MPLRTAAASDAASLAALSMEVWIGTYLRRGINAFFADYALSTFTKAQFEAHLASPDDHFIVSDNEDGIDGFIRISQNSSPPLSGCSTTEISTLYVQPRHHGKGIGKRLLEAGIAHCSDLGVNSVWLTTNSENSPAIRFYLAQGFRHAGNTHFRIKDQSFLNDVFAYDIAAKERAS